MKAMKVTCCKNVARASIFHHLHEWGGEVAYFTLVENARPFTIFGNNQ